MYEITSLPAPLTRMLLPEAGTALAELAAIVLSLAVHWKLVGLLNAGLIPLTVAVPSIRVTLPNTI